jgi:hypothetical protein
MMCPRRACGFGIELCDVNALIDDISYMFTCHVYRHEMGLLGCSLTHTNMDVLGPSSFPSFYHSACEDGSTYPKEVNQSIHVDSLLLPHGSNLQSSDLGWR